MKMQIRAGVFETNSSAVHALCFLSKGLGKCRLKVHDDGYVHVKLDEYFGKDPKKYFTQADKLKYIVAWIYTYEGFEESAIEDSYVWRGFVEEFCEYVNSHNEGVNCLGIKVDCVLGDDSYAYFDHQCLNGGRWDDNCVISLWTPHRLVEFIFNKYIGLNTGCD